MSVQISVVNDDVAAVAADVLMLKYARSFYGADEAVALRLTNHGICQESALTPDEGKVVLFESNGAVAADRVMFVGTTGLRNFRYREIRNLAKRGIEALAEQHLTIRTLATTVHGLGCGLDIEESFHSLMMGYQQGLAAYPLPSLEQIIVVERTARRFEILSKLAADVKLLKLPSSSGLRSGSSATRQEAEPRKKMVFVAMPFAEDFEDVYQFGIYNTVRRCGYVCEKVDESAYAGSIIDRIIEGIRQAEFVIADLTLERPNVYLEVGYAWGLQRPVILIAREGQRLHFDLSHHKCLFYRTIGKLSEALEKNIRELFQGGNPS